MPITGGTETATETGDSAETAVGDGSETAARSVAAMLERMASISGAPRSLFATRKPRMRSSSAGVVAASGARQTVPYAVCQREIVMTTYWSEFT